VHVEETAQQLARCVDAGAAGGAVHRVDHFDRGSGGVVGSHEERFALGRRGRLAARLACVDLHQPLPGIAARGAQARFHGRDLALNCWEVAVQQAVCFRRAFARSELDECVHCAPRDARRHHQVQPGVGGSTTYAWLSARAMIRSTPVDAFNLRQGSLQSTAWCRAFPGSSFLRTAPTVALVGAKRHRPAALPGPFGATRHAVPERWRPPLQRVYRLERIQVAATPARLKEPLWSTWDAISVDLHQ
jgi:hypothetical protein